MVKLKTAFPEYLGTKSNVTEPVIRITDINGDFLAGRLNLGADGSETDNIRYTFPIAA